MSASMRFIMVGVLALAAWARSPAEARSVGPAGARPPARPLGVAVRDSARRIDANRINMFAWNSGQLAWDPRSFGGGLFFPKGTDRSVIFASGLWLGARVGSEVRVSVAEYSSEYEIGRAHV